MANQLYEQLQAQARADYDQRQAEKNANYDADARSVLGDSYHGTTAERDAYRSVRDSGYSNNNIYEALKAGYSWDEIKGVAPQRVYGHRTSKNFAQTPISNSPSTPRNPLYSGDNRPQTYAGQGSMQNDLSKIFEERFNAATKGSIDPDSHLEQLMQEEKLKNGESEYYKWLANKLEQATKQKQAAEQLNSFQQEYVAHTSQQDKQQDYQFLYNKYLANGKTPEEAARLANEEIYQSDIFVSPSVDPRNYYMQRYGNPYGDPTVDREAQHYLATMNRSYLK